MLRAAVDASGAPRTRSEDAHSNFCGAGSTLTEEPCRQKTAVASYSALAAQARPLGLEITIFTFLFSPWNASLTCVSATKDPLFGTHRGKSP